MTNTTINKILLSAATAMFLTACGSSGGGGSDADTTKPVIKLNDKNNITLTVGETYTDAGAKATDDVDGDITKNIKTTGSVDTTKAGTYTITYTVSDAAGNTTIVKRTIKVNAPANTKPVATAKSVTVAEDTTDNEIILAGTDKDGDTLTYAIVSQPAHGTVTLTGNTAKYTPTADYFGDDSFTFKVNDGKVDSDEATVSITVTDVVDDLTPPVITLVGTETVDVLINTPYTDAGATASDTIDGNITAKIVTTSDVNTSTAGDYTVTYTVSDDANNTATATRTVTVHATQFVGGTDTVTNIVTGLVLDKEASDVNACVAPKTAITIEQLQSIMDYSKYELAIVDGFALPQDNTHYLTSDGWDVELQYGVVQIADSNISKTICVDATAETLPTLETLTRDDDNNTVTDPNNNLIWDDIDVNVKNYTDAEAACTAKGMRLPTLIELDSIYDRTNKKLVEPFTELHNGYTWTSTVAAANSNDNWIIHIEQDDINNTVSGRIKGAANNDTDKELFYTCVKDAN